MRFLGHILLACVAITALRWGLKVAMTAMFLGLILVLVRAPVQTLSVLFGLVLLNAFAAHPLPGLILCILAMLSAKFSGE